MCWHGQRKSFDRAQMKKRIIAWSFGAFLLALCGSVDAQQTGKVFQIGLLDNGTTSGMAVLWSAFREEMSKLGWVEGKNLTIEYRFGEGKRDHLPELAADLVRLKVDLIVAAGDPATSAAKKATTSTPIVMASASDPRRF